VKGGIEQSDKTYACGAKQEHVTMQYKKGDHTKKFTLSLESFFGCISMHAQISMATKRCRTEKGPVV